MQTPFYTPLQASAHPQGNPWMSAVLAGSLWLYRVSWPWVVSSVHPHVNKIVHI